MVLDLPSHVDYSTDMQLPVFMELIMVFKQIRH
jgi:hypothetical protein